jgi:hypothetical protein
MMLAFAARGRPQPIDVQGVHRLRFFRRIEHRLEPMGVELAARQTRLDAVQHPQAFPQLAPLEVEPKCSEELVGSPGAAGEIEDAESVGGDEIGPPLIFFFNVSKNCAW